MIVRPPIPFVCERLYAALCTYPKLTVLGYKYLWVSTNLGVENSRVVFVLVGIQMPTCD